MLDFLISTLSRVQYLKLRTLQRQSYTHYFYEATVGAGLPIISTLQGLLETGDKILRIEGIFRLVFLQSYLEEIWLALFLCLESICTGEGRTQGVVISLHPKILKSFV